MSGGSFEAIWSWIRSVLFWAPDWLSGIAILVLAGVLALIVHRILFVLLDRVFATRHPFLHQLLRASKGVAAFALVAVSLSVGLQTASFDPTATTVLTRLLLIAFIVLDGWIAHVAVEIASNLYLRRFHIESTDNLLARKHVTQVHILKRAVDTLIVLVTLGFALMTFEQVREYGVSLFASAGVAGLVAGLAARPVLSNLIAGIQIATTQPIRIDDQVIVENESGRIEEITSTYVVVRLWDLRRMIVPLTYFIEKPFQNWTREATNLIGTVFLYVDYTAPVERIRAKLEETVKASPLWDGNVVKLHVTDAKDMSIELRMLASARNAGDAFNLRCEIREKLIDFLQREYPTALPRQRQETIGTQTAALAPGERPRSASAR